MRRGRLFLYLFLIIIIGVGAIALVATRFLKQPAAIVSEGEVVPTPTVTPELLQVVVLTQRVSRGQVLDETVIGMVPLQKEFFIPGMFKDPKEAIGRKMKLDVDSGILLMANMLGEDLSRVGSDWALEIPKGQVAVSIPIDRQSAVAFGLRRGDYVNVIATMLFVDLDAIFQSKLPNTTAMLIAPGPQGEPGTSPVALTLDITGKGDAGILGRSEVDAVLEQPYYTIPSESQRPRMVAQTLIQNVRVLWVGTFPQPEEEEKPTPTPAAVAVGTPTPASVPEQGQPAQQQPTPTPKVITYPDIITLIVSPQDAVMLNYMLQSGARLSLVMRRFEDDTAMVTEPVTLQFLLDQYGIPIPVKLPYGLEPRVDVIVPPALSGSQATPVP
jgi:Flp pilus assembly protein CpaB